MDKKEALDRSEAVAHSFGNLSSFIREDQIFWADLEKPGLKCLATEDSDRDSEKQATLQSTCDINPSESAFVCSKNRTVRDILRHLQEQTEATFLVEKSWLFGTRMHDEPVRDLDTKAKVPEWRYNARIGIPFVARL
ncbi:hypothetical protein TNCV_3632541 [Trichonephila clavipes]|nr:hypothetical protein TNCV_3632541 [Trichonephila clavipes]